MPGHLAATVVLGGGELLMFGRTYAQVSGIAPEHARARYLSVYGTSWGFALVLAPLCATRLIAYAGPTGLWGTLALIALLLAVAQPLVVRPLLGRPGLTTR